MTSETVLHGYFFFEFCQAATPKEDVLVYKISPCSEEIDK